MLFNIGPETMCKVIVYDIINKCVEIKTADKPRQICIDLIQDIIAKIQD